VNLQSKKTADPHQFSPNTPI